MRLDGLTIGITGAARGIGRGIAHRSAVEGAGVTIGDLDDAAAEMVVAEIARGGGTAAACHVAVTNRTSVQDFVAH